MSTCKLASEVCACFLCHSEVHMCLHQCVLYVCLGAFYSQVFFWHIIEYFIDTMSRPVAHQPFIGQSCAVRERTCGGGSGIDGYLAGEEGQMGGHSLITWIQSDSQCACVFVCEITRRSVTGHQMLTVGLNYRKLESGGTVSGYSAHSLSLSCTCTQYNKP